MEECKVEKFTFNFGVGVFAKRGLNDMKFLLCFGWDVVGCGRASTVLCR